MIKLLLPLLLSGFVFDAAAQASAEEDAGRPTRSPWGIGVAAAISDSPYVGEGTRVIPVPLLSYEGERFYFRGVTAGWRLVDSDALSVSLVGKARFDGFDVDDLDRAGLARNGVDADLLSDRKRGLDVGVVLEWSGLPGEVQVELLTDATDRSSGQEASLQYGYPLRVGTGLLTPLVGATWWSADLADYYYGTLREEVVRGVMDYRPGAVTMPHAGVSFFKPLGRTWSLVGSVRYTRWPDVIRRSPLLEAGSDGSVSMFVGVSRGFHPWWMKTP